jgi:hypothetical protein
MTKQDATKVEHCHNHKQIADILMKPFPRAKHSQNVEEKGLAPAWRGVLGDDTWQPGATG